MTEFERVADAETTAGRRRALLVFQRETDVDVTAATAAGIRAAAASSGLDQVTVEAYQSTGSYRPDPNRRQEFVSVAAAVQIDYSADREPGLVRLMQSLEVPTPAGGVTISVGHVVTCLQPTGPNLLLLGAQRRADLTPEQFGRHWSQVHAPRAVNELRAAQIPIGYELFLVDHDLSSAMATDRWRPSDVDGWMHITTRGPSDFANIARNPEHSAWVLEDEVNFVNFAAPLVGQQMHSVPPSTTAPSPPK